MSKPIDPREIYFKLDEYATEYVKASGKFVELDNARKSVLAEIILRKYADIKTAQKQQMHGEADMEYRTYLKGLAIAHKEYLSMRLKYENLKLATEMARTKEATERLLLKNADLEDR